MRIFDTFPEGLALIKGGEIIYANESLTNMLELHEYVHEDDPTRSELRSILKNTKLTKLDLEIMKKTSVWDFIESNSSGAAYELNFFDEEGVPHKERRHNFMPSLEG